MINQNVFLKLKEGITKEQTDKLAEELKGLEKLIPNTTFVKAGYNVSQENKNMGFDYGFTLIFSDENSLNNYINHPEHQKVVENYLAPLITCSEDVFVFAM